MELKGIGHFTIWFLLGFCIFSVVRLLRGEDRKLLAPITLYLPFAPFILGGISVIPYLLVVLGVISHEQASGITFNIFLFYGLLERASFLKVIFGNFELNVAMLASIYLYFIWYYIDLVKKTRIRYAK
jgi:hypothetical protein